MGPSFQEQYMIDMRTRNWRMGRVIDKGTFSVITLHLLVALTTIADLFLGC